MHNNKFIGFSRFIPLLPVLLMSLRVDCAVLETAGLTLEVPLQEQIRLAMITGETTLLGNLIDRIADKTTEVLLSAFNTGIQARRLDVLKYLLGRAEFPARDFSKESDSDLYSLLNDSQDEGLLRLMLKKGAVKLHREIVPAIHSIDLAAELKLDSWKKSNHYSPLCYVKSPEVAQYLIDHGYSPKTDYPSSSPLTEVDRVDVAEVLISNGAEYRFQFPAPMDQTGEVCHWKHWSSQTLPHVKTREIAELLIERGCRYDFPDYTGYYPIHCGSITPTVLILLLELGLSPDLLDGFGIPPLFYFTSQPEKARILLSHGADPMLRKSRWNIDISEQYSSTLEISAHIKSYESRKQDRNAVEKPGYTLLHCAGNGDFVRLIVEAGLDPNVRGGEYGETPLHTVTDPGALSALIEAGADVNARDSLGDTPIFNRALNLAGLKCLIKYGADPEAKNSKGAGVMEMHLDAECQEYLKQFCREETPPFSRNICITCNPFAFQEAVANGANILEPFDFSAEKDEWFQKRDGLLPLLELLKNRRCNIDHGESFCCDQVYFTLIQKFLDQGGDPQITDREGRTLLALCPRIEAARMLEKKGFNFRSTIGLVLDNAVQENGNEDFVRYLLKKGGLGLREAEKVYPNGTSHRIIPLTLCLPEYIEMLVQAGFSPDAIDFGMTPLTYAVEMFYHPGYLQKTEKLIAAGADINLADGSGLTPLHYAVYFYCRDMAADNYGTLADEALQILKVLRDGGADPRAKNRDGDTALDMLRKSCQEEEIAIVGKVAEIAKMLE
ncbi:MAG: ankyrin repeat domain-containing protein [Candidatus Wallbacteria bacterium]|nr:ankyrin repeat domain-containing protein [Candidatus Wallbacteria bacterium]